MIPIKIECGCGQRYAFEVEPVRGLMPSAVACPACGTDGTSAANDVIIQNTSVQPAMTVEAPGPLRIAGLAPSNHPTAPPESATAEAPKVGQPRSDEANRAQAVTEAKAKVSWGDPPKAIITFLMSRGFTYQEAQGQIKEMFEVRAVEIRRFGFGKIVGGAGLMCVPVVALFIFLKIGYLPIKLFAFTIMIGLWGAWMVLKGIFMVISPKTEAGDVAEQ